MAGRRGSIRQWWRTRALRTQVWAIVFGLAFVTLASGLIGYAWLAREQVLDSQMRSLRQQSSVALSSVVAAYELGGRGMATEALELFRVSPDFDSAAVYDDRGVLVTALVAPKEGPFPNTLSEIAVSRGSLSQSPVWSSSLVSEGKSRALGTLVVRGNLGRIQSEWRASVMMFAAATVFGSLLIALAAWWMGSSITRSMANLTRWTTALPEGANGHLAAPEVSGREAIALKTAFERILTRLKEQNAQLSALSNRLRDENSKLERISFRDPLTQIPNRRAAQREIDARLAATARDARGLAIVFVDLDRFKIINDQFGHLVGDDVLRTCARRLEQALRPGDFVARYAGDEFLLLIDGIASREGADVLKTRLAHDLETVGMNDDWQEPISASIGVALFPLDGSTAEALLDAADRSMYASKITRTASLAHWH